MRAESKNCRRKRQRRERAQLKAAYNLIENWRAPYLAEASKKIWWLESQIRQRDSELKNLSKNYLDVCKELHDLRKLPEPIILLPEYGYEKAR